MTKKRQTTRNKTKMRQLEKKLQSQGGAYSLCEVCNLQLTSAAQAQLHYNGRSHLRRVRQLHSSSSSHSQSNTSRTSGCHMGGPLPGLIGATGPSVMMKPFLSFPVETTSPVGLFPNFNTVHERVLLTVCCSFKQHRPTVISIRPIRSREKLNSSSPSLFQSQAEAHYRGSRHRASSLQPSLGPPSSGPFLLLFLLFLFFQILSSSSSSSSRHLLLFLPCSSSSPSQDAPPSAESEEEKAKKLLYCSLCKVAVNSLSQLEAHNAGSKHKTMLEARSGAGPIKAYPRPGAKLKNGSSSALKGSGLQNKTFHCQICDVHVNSEIQLKQHISSRRHKDRVAGKPSKPKYSPYNKQQRSSLTKELVKPSLSPSFLSTPFAPPSSSLTSSISLPPVSLSSSPLLTPTSSPLTPTISLHPRPPASSSLFTASFLRPAPGPIRASQGSILFTPY
uniref:Zinc finger protein 385B n=1 Tax=Amphiprion percula TaxID=161767 RepID=A0A3P8RUY2_AMPPE